MKIADLAYLAPSSLDEAVALLAANEGAKLISGGQSLMPMMAFRIAAPTLLIDLKNIDAMNQIDIGESGVRLGARVRWVDIETHRALREAHPLLVEAIDQVAHYQVRNRGTVGGSVAHADPSAEMPGVAVTCDAQIEVIGPSGYRKIDAVDFFAGALQTSIEENEIITAVHLPRWTVGRHWGFEEFALRRGDFAMAGALLHYDLDSEQCVVDAHVGAIGVADHAIRIETAEAALNGAPLSPASIEAAVTAACMFIEPNDDLHASSDYRRALYGNMLRRVLNRSRVSATQELL